MLTEPITVTLLVVEALESLQIPYFVGGSLATAVHGVARATLDVDLVADIQIQHAAPLVETLGDAFFADVKMIRSSIRQGLSFNLIHKETMFKVDVFPKKERPFDNTQFERRTAYPITDDPQHTVYFATPEDTILAKLEWYRMGGETSDRQWKDILKVIKIQGEHLDLGYLENWAVQLEVADLLERALDEAK